MSEANKVLCRLFHLHHIRLVFTLLCLSWCCVETSAQTFSFPAITYLDSIKLRDVVSTSHPDTITVRQADYNVMTSATAGGPHFTIKSILALTNFKVNVQSLDIGQKHDFTYVITYKTIGIANPASPSVAVSAIDTLSVSYNRDSLALINDRAFNIAGKFHEIKVVIYDVFEITNGASGPVYTHLSPAAAASVPTFVSVYGEIHLQKFITYSTLTVSSSNVAFSDNINTSGTVNLDWTAAYGHIKPAGYEVEWA